ncbi:MAG: S-layer homology domain-containing protein [Anaerocolumna sp.]
MKHSKKSINITLLLAIIILLSGVLLPTPPIANAASSSSKIKVSDFIRIVVQATGITIDKGKSSPYLSAAMTAGIVKSGDFKDYKAYLTRTDTALILNRADEYLYGDTLDRKLLKIVMEERISDISKITKSKREAVAKVYAKGYMKGYSNGYYIKSREFRGNEYMTIAGARGAVAMLKDTKKRTKISPDGQLIRTTNLPKNAKDYEYILTTYPNSFYEMKFMYQMSTFYFEPVELEHYASPVRFKDIIFCDGAMQSVLDKYLETWVNRVETNLKYRLNVNYKTINNSWINGLRSSYTQYGDAYSDKRITDEIKKYVEVVKKNKIVIQSKTIIVEPSTLYQHGAGYYLRTYVKFKLTYSGSKLTSNELIGGDRVLLESLKKDTWFTGVYDIKLGTVNGSSNGSDYYVTNDSLIDY